MPEPSVPLAGRVVQATRGRMVPKVGRSIRNIEVEHFARSPGRWSEHWPIPFELSRAPNGRKCLSVLSRAEINVASIDVNMPEMSGIEAVDAAPLAGNRTFLTTTLR